MAFSALCSAEDGEVQNAAADADSILDLLQLRLRKLPASAGEDVPTGECMFELARRLDGRARYEEAEELYRKCLRISTDLSFPPGARVIALVLRLVLFRFLMKGTGAVLLLGCFCHEATEVVSFPKHVTAKAQKTPRCIDFCSMTLGDAGSRLL